MTAEQRQFLETAGRLALEDTDEPFPLLLRSQTAPAVFDALGWDWADNGLGRGFQMVRTLASLDLVSNQSTMQTPKFYLRFYGLVLGTETLQLELQALIGSLLPYWETVNVDFKEQLPLNSPKQKGEFARDVLCLANTQVTGSRYIVIGFSDRTRSFTRSVDDNITRDRLEDILNAYTRPAVQVRYNQVPWETGVAGLIEVLSDRTKVPYRAARETSSLKDGEVYVRRSTHCNPATQEEVSELEEEARRSLMGDRGLEERRDDLP